MQVMCDKWLPISYASKDFVKFSFFCISVAITAQFHGLLQHLYTPIKTTIAACQGKWDSYFIK